MTTDAKLTFTIATPTLDGLRQVALERGITVEGLMVEILAGAATDTLRGKRRE
jgi:hypothetical protein